MLAEAYIEALLIDEELADQDKVLALMKAVKVTGIEPFEQPARYPKIDPDEVRLVCWLSIQARDER